MSLEPSSMRMSALKTGDRKLSIPPFFYRVRTQVEDGMCEVEKQP